MPRGTTFLDALTTLNAQNFLSGIAVAGKAIKEKRQHDKFLNLYDEFRSKQNALEDAITQKQKAGGIAKQAGLVDDMNVENGLPKDVEFAITQNNVLRNMNELSKLYQPFIAGFSTLGDEGVRLSNRLSKELANKLSLQESQLKAPLNELRYQKLVQDTKLNAIKIEQLHENNTKQKLVDNYVGLIMQDSLFNELPKGKLAVFINKNGANPILDKLNIIRGAIQKKLSAGKGFDPSIYALAFSKALQLNGTNITGKEVSPSEYLKMKDYEVIGDTGIKLNEYKTSLDLAQQISLNWQAKDKDFQDKVRAYMRGESLNLEANDPYTKQVIAMANDINKLYKLQSTLMTASSAMGVNWFSLKDRKVKRNGKEMTLHIPDKIIYGRDINGKPLYIDTSDIMRISSPYNFANGITTSNDWDPTFATYTFDNPADVGNVTQPYEFSVDSLYGGTPDFFGSYSTGQLGNAKFENPTDVFNVIKKKPRKTANEFFQELEKLKNK